MIDIKTVSEIISDLKPTFSITSIPHVEYRVNVFGEIKLDQPEWMKAKLSDGTYIKIYYREYFNSAQWFQYSPRVLRKNNLKFIESHRAGQRDLFNGNDTEDPSAAAEYILPEALERLTQDKENDPTLWTEFQDHIHEAVDIYHGLYDNFYSDIVNNKWKDILPEVLYHDEKYMVTEWLTGEFYTDEQVVPLTTDTLLTITSDTKSPDFDTRMNDDLSSRIKSYTDDTVFPLTEVQKHLSYMNDYVGFTFNVRPLSDNPDENVVKCFRSWPCTKYQLAKGTYFNKYGDTWKINTMRHLAISHVASC